MSVYQSLDYRKNIQFLILSRRRMGQKLTQQMLAEAIGLQKSHFSQIMSEQTDMNQDQMFYLTEFFDLNKEQSEYMHLCLEYARTAIADRKKRLKLEIKAIQKEKNATQEYLNVDSELEEKQRLTDFYLNPYNQLVLLLLGFEEFKKDPNSIAHQIGLSEARVQTILQELQSLGLIQSDEKDIRVFKKAMHLKKDSKVFPVWSSQMRQLALQKALQLDGDQTYNFSVFFSASEKTKKEIQKRFFEFIQEAQKLSGESKKDGIYQINFDLLTWF